VSKFIRYITPVGKRDAAGVVSRVYQQSARDLGRLAEPIVILSPAPDILAGYWALMREANVIGQAPARTRRQSRPSYPGSTRAPGAPTPTPASSTQLENPASPT
jgi:hypothetical protein